MPRQISRTNRRNLIGPTTPVNHLTRMLEYTLMPQLTLGNANQQNAFNYAMELYHRPNATEAHKNLASSVFTKLVRNYNRTWTQPVPPAARFRVNSNSNNGTNFLARAQQRFRAAYAPAAGGSGQPTAAAAAAPNYSKASGAVKKWLAARPHTVHQNAVHIKLPANATDPVSYNNFKSGNEAVMVIKKRLQANGAMRSKRTFYTKKSIGGLAATHRRIAAPHSNPVPWRTIMRMKGSDVVFKDPFNRRAVYRRDLMNVKFV